MLCIPKTSPHVIKQITKQPCNFWNGDPCTGKTISLCWISSKISQDIPAHLELILKSFCILSGLPFGCFPEFHEWRDRHMKAEFSEQTVMTYSSMAPEIREKLGMCTLSHDIYAVLLCYVVLWLYQEFLMYLCDIFTPILSSCFTGTKVK